MLVVVDTCLMQYAIRITYSPLQGVTLLLKTKGMLLKVITEKLQIQQFNNRIVKKVQALHFSGAVFQSISPSVICLESCLNLLNLV